MGVDMTNNRAVEILEKFCTDMGVQLEIEWKQSMRELRKTFLEKALDDAIRAHSHFVSPSDRPVLLNQLDPELFPLTTG